jgi:hypothetical protein
MARINALGAAVAQACGLAAVGNGTGNRDTERG